ncbi:transient receptor potential cation channel subfamily A member, partial [Clonorchis sinensis]
RLEYFKDWNNYLEFLLNALAMTYSALTLVLHVDHHYVGLGVIVMFLAWFNFLLQMMRFNHVGIYVVMFLHVLATVGKCLVVFSVVFVAFALSFHVLFRIPQYKECNTGVISVSDLLEVRDRNKRFFTMYVRCSPVLIHALLPRLYIAPHLIGYQLTRCYLVLPGVCQCQKVEPAVFECALSRGYMNRAWDHRECASHKSQGILELANFMLVLMMFFDCRRVFDKLIGLAVGDIEHVRQSSVLRLISQQVYWLADWEPKLMSIFRSKIYSPYWKRKCKRDANVTLRRALRSALRIYMYRDISNIVVTGTLGGLVQHIQLPGNITSERLSWFPGLSINTDEPVRLASVLAATSACQPIPTASGVSKSIV